MGLDGRRWIILAACTALSAVLLVLSMPPMSWWPLGWVSLIPVACAVHRGGFMAGFLAGLAAALGAGAFASTGLLYPSHLHWEGSTGWTMVGFSLFAIIASLSLGASAEGLPWWATACLAVLFEAASMIYIPLHLGLSQWPSGGVLFLSSLGGIFLASGLVWLLQMAAAWAIVERRLWGLTLLPAAGLLSLPMPPGPEGGVAIAMIQTDLSAGKSLEELTKEADQPGVAVIVQPELSGSSIASGGDPEGLVDLSKATKAAIITSYADNSQPKPFNKAVYLRGGQILGAYRKRKLFAEERGIHQAGKDAATAVDGQLTVGMTICFDTCFPAEMRRTASQGEVNLILSPTLDPPTSHGVIQAIHAAFTPFRAAELGIPIVRADTTASSMAVDSWGRVLAWTPPGERVDIVQVTPERRWTLYRAVGDWPLLLAAGGFVAGWFQVRRRKAVSDDPPADA